MNQLIVVDRLSDWPHEIGGTQCITAADYLSGDSALRGDSARVYNLCRSTRYQANGYYVSLLAAARGHRAIPDVATLQDLKTATTARLVGDTLTRLIDQSLKALQSDEFSLSIYFGQNLAKRHERLAKALYNECPAPLLRARFKRRAGEWELEGLRSLALADVPAEHRDFLGTAAAAWFGKRRRSRTPRKSQPYGLAILVNPAEADPPSDEDALVLFEAAAEQAGFEPTRIGRDDYGELAEYDALFIRETTYVNHHTYRFARRAAREGLAVMDDPDSILRCTNKVFLAERLARSGIATPATLVVHRGNTDQLAPHLGFPMVLKQPDSAFSRGVVKVNDAAELKRELKRLFDTSDLLIAQAYSPTDYDWRVGVLDGQPLYVCRYFMAPAHWQIVKHGERGEKSEGRAQTLPLQDVPAPMLRLAVRAAAAMGNGLYGVDIKQVGQKFFVIEVNDNPSIDGGVEDAATGNGLYLTIMQSFRRRVEARRHERP